MPEVLTEIDPEDSVEKFILSESKKGNVVFNTGEGLISVPLEEFVKQPTDGILYDLNRLPEVVLTFLPDPKWVNDFAVQEVIRYLRNKVAELEGSK